jgi:hypothetical protein
MPGDDYKEFGASCDAAEVEKYVLAFVGNL